MFWNAQELKVYFIEYLNPWEMSKFMQKSPYLVLLVTLPNQNLTFVA